MHTQMVKGALSDLDAIHVHKGFMGIALQYTDRGIDKLLGDVYCLKSLVQSNLSNCLRSDACDFAYRTLVYHFTTLFMVARR
jgi:hypothetical protein